ncbi:MAG: hypothetical protein ACOYLV_02225 [Rubrivivax sp.]
MRAAERLAEQLRAESQPAARAVLELRLAALAAAQGRFEEVSDTLLRVRQAFPGQASAELSAWLSLVEGVLRFHQSPDEAARDRLQRAHALARLAPGCGALGPATAWLAHLHFNQGRLDACGELAREALGQARPDDHAVLARLALTLASAWMTAGQANAAYTWFERARQQAVREGDSAMLGAVLHDSAVFELHEQRLAWAGLVRQQPPGQDGLGGPVQARLDSARHYEDLARLRALPELQALARASLCVLQDEPAPARVLLEGVLDRLDGAGLQRYDAPARADLLWCDCVLAQRAAGPGVTARALQAPQTQVDDVVQRLARTPDLDDRFLVHATLARALAAAGQDGPAAQQRRLADELGARLADSRQELHAQLHRQGLEASTWDTLYGS